MDRNARVDMPTLFIHFLEGRMTDITQADLQASFPLILPEVGEGLPPVKALLYENGQLTTITASSSNLHERGLKPYPYLYLTTHHALTLTKALAIFHVTSFTEASTQQSISSHACTSEKKMWRTESCVQSCANEETHTEDGCSNFRSTPRRPQDKLTAEVSRLELVQANLSILTNHLRYLGLNPQTVQRLEALQTELPTLTQFLQFASVMQPHQANSIGPIGISDVWIPAEEGEEDVLVIRLRCGMALQAPILRDAAWTWLTLLNPEILRELYMELCSEYCTAHNKALSQYKTQGNIEEISLFDVMQQLGENLLHSFITIVHKFVVSGTWFFDRQLHTEEGLQVLSEIIGFLIDNGIIGSIFVI